MKSKKLIITPFFPVHQKATRKLILTGLGEHWRWIDENVNTDLENSAISYSEDYFLLGWLNNTLVASGALVHEDNNTYRVVRMSVAKNFRCQGFGSQIFDNLVKIARQTLKNKIVLETTETWNREIEFYKSKGF